MKRIILPLLVAVFLAIGLQDSVSAHCEVPCGIYGDTLRFESMIEDHRTIQKAMAQIHALAGKADAQSHNQLARWVATKESHATKTQHTIAQYFMSQRIKAKDPKYVAKLTTAHAVMVAAMKCKQNVDASHANALHAAIGAFYRAYEGRKLAAPEHGHEHK